MLDLESIRLFVLTADLGNLTRAAEAAGTVQPVVSQRLRALEERLGCRLLDRNARRAVPTAEGAAFLERARRLLSAHDAALGFRDDGDGMELRLGISDHALGLSAGPLFQRLRTSLPTRCRLEVRVGLSQNLRGSFDAGALDAVIIRREAGGQEGESLGLDPLGWRGLASAHVPGQPLCLATLGAPCGVRAQAIRALEQAGIPWRESLVAGSCAMLADGARAGLGIAPMGRLAGGDLPELGHLLRLPALKPSEIVLLGRQRDAAMATALRVLAAGVRAVL
ncbi:LysR family transcriptional regulator [Niveispirillum sp. KHB5.9]|uniref:LysR family transcriptional regulator n=1 Tax=Niveispirillum sp. KHB5.9 TaxID=3400269 RepID=UPI003A860CAC